MAIISSSLSIVQTIDYKPISSQQGDKNVF